MWQKVLFVGNYEPYKELSYLKIQLLYLHLTDNEAFRIECELSEIVSDKHYTKKEIKEIIEFAKDNITVIPEIEMPGHMASVTKVYPGGSLKIKQELQSYKNRFDQPWYEFVENLLNEFVPCLKENTFT